MSYEELRARGDRCAVPAVVDGLPDWPMWIRMTSDVAPLCLDHLRWSLAP